MRQRIDPTLDLFQEVVMAGTEKADVLRRRADEIVKFKGQTHALVRKLAHMCSADQNAWGLAAPQIGVSQRAFAFRRELGGKVWVVCNPVVEPEGAEMIEDYEGCFSLPLVRVQVARFRSVRLSGMDAFGKWLFGDLVLEGMAARVVQHEMDHLDGKLIVDHGTAEDISAGEKISTGG